MTDDYWGLCPRCHAAPDQYLNVYKAHYFVCHRDKTRWMGGYNLFSVWQDESPELWETNRALLRGYTHVEPIYPNGAPADEGEGNVLELVRPDFDYMDYVLFGSDA